ncbi:MAG TPA: hypothetical protein VF245_12765 [Solirubrobacterales bacterium]
MPWDSTAQREASGLGNEAADTRASLSNRWQQQQEEMGLGEGASNPYSHASQLARERDNNQRGVTNTAGNNLYSGSTVNAQRQTQSQYDEGFNQLTAAYDRSKQAFERGSGKTERDYQQGMAAIKEGAINRALASEPQPLAPGGGGGARRAGRRAPARRAPARRPAGRRGGGLAAMGAIAYGGRRRRR